MYPIDLKPQKVAKKLDPFYNRCFIYPLTNSFYKKNLLLLAPEMNQIGKVFDHEKTENFMDKSVCLSRSAKLCSSSHYFEVKTLPDRIVLR